MLATWYCMNKNANYHADYPRRLERLVSRYGHDRRLNRRAYSHLFTLRYVTEGIDQIEVRNASQALAGIAVMMAW